MLANSTYCSPLEGLKCVNVVLNNCSDRASSSHIKFICTKQSGSDLPLFTKSHFHRLSAVSTTSPYLSASSKNHRFLTCVVVKRMPLHPALMKSSFTPTGRVQISVILRLHSACHSRLLSYFWTLILSSSALAVPVFAT